MVHMRVPHKSIEKTINSSTNSFTQHDSIYDEPPKDLLEIAEKVATKQYWILCATEQAMEGKHFQYKTFNIGPYYYTLIPKSEVSSEELSRMLYNKTTQIHKDAISIGNEMAVRYLIAEFDLLTDGSN